MKRNDNNGRLENVTAYAVSEKDSKRVYIFEIGIDARAISRVSLVNKDIPHQEYFSININYGCTDKRGIDEIERDLMSMVGAGEVIRRSLSQKSRKKSGLARLCLGGRR